MTAAHDSLLGSLRTGDLVLLAPAALLPWLPGRLARRRWNHVALVIREDHPEPMILETAPAGAASSGVRLRRLVKRLATHSGRISVRRLNRALTPAQCEKLAAWRHELERRQSRRSLMDLMAAGEDGWLGGERASLDAPLPGELIAEAYQRLGLLESAARTGLPASHFRPRHFAEGAGLELKLGYVLGPELALRGPDEDAAPAPLAPLPA